MILPQIAIIEEEGGRDEVQVIQVTLMRTRQPDATIKDMRWKVIHGSIAYGESRKVG